jgi:hypothetical protein
VANGSLQHTHISGAQGRNGFEYLGFRLDGRRVFLRDSTVSGFFRKKTFCARHGARVFVARYQGKDFPFLSAKFDYEAFMRRFGRVEEFDETSEYGDWTFWTFARRAREIFGPRGEPVIRQLSRHREFIRSTITGKSKVPCQRQVLHTEPGQHDPFGAFQPRTSGAIPFNAQAASSPPAPTTASCSHRDEPDDGADRRWLMRLLN